MHQPTLRDVLTTLTRHLNTLNEALALHVVDNGEIAIIKEELAFDFPGTKSQCVELIVGAMYGLLKNLLGDDWRPLSVHFTHAAPADLSTHRRFLKCDLEFESGFNGIVLPVSDLQRPNRTGNPGLAHYAQRYLETLHPDSPISMINEARKAIYLLLPLGNASIARVARTLGMHERTLQRRLAAEGHDFSDLVKEARRDLALRYIADRRHSITRISETLGYGQLSSFTRWFSGEFGVSPAEWRRQHS
jgi:AraC-like DNA-binding protein